MDRKHFRSTCKKKKIMQMGKETYIPFHKERRKILQQHKGYEKENSLIEGLLQKIKKRVRGEIITILATETKDIRPSLRLAEKGKSTPQEPRLDTLHMQLTFVVVRRKKIVFGLAVLVTKIG
ncbi:hypothetical protein NPIL_209641 [Nephila pilipes]|uniref:Uncharacterized protein n=1 Tax=Nephila pilipes TaxID=299642 RepID=A0A8X6UEN4_NEPPI|nr:hypothetical protein NPIL_287171 [Nephila pilipes]GFU02631.1 hypothetical protein NPIL_209641 [Nephila pilipes]